MDFHKQCSNQLIRSVIAVFLVVALTVRSSDAEDAKPAWNYIAGNVNGPTNWKNNYPECDGTMQSPINIVSSKAVPAKDLEQFDFSDYYNTDGVEMKLENVRGRTAEVVMSGRELLLKGGSLSAPYKLAQFHFHWGGNTSRGSEHSLDGKYSPMEIHFVHYHTRFNTFTDAACKPNGLAVLSFFFEPGKHNENYQPLIENLPKIPNADDETEIETLLVGNLIPSPPFQYYRYDGSLTTPPCCESVIWSVSSKKIQISQAQLSAFRDLLDDTQQKLADDYRPPQPTNKRTVLTTTKTVKA